VAKAVSDTWEKTIEIVLRLPFNNGIPNFTRASAFKHEAVQALKAARATDEKGKQ
jgi:hypothetical protein